jgi:hypothetical protein
MRHTSTMYQNFPSGVGIITGGSDGEADQRAIAICECLLIHVLVSLTSWSKHRRENGGNFCRCESARHDQRSPMSIATPPVGLCVGEYDVGTGVGDDVGGSEVVGSE